MTKYKEVKQILGVILILVGLALILFTSGLVQGSFITAKGTYNMGDSMGLCSNEFIAYDCPNAAQKITVQKSGSSAIILVSGSYSVTKGAYFAKCAYETAGTSFAFPSVGSYYVKAGFFCRTTQKMISSESGKNINIAAGCVNECSVSTCIGSVYKECRAMSDGCKDQLAGRTAKGMCGVECTSNSDCGTNCFSHSRKDCKSDGDAYWIDSCGKWEEKAQDCSSSQYCENGACINNPPVCSSYADTRCEGNEAYYYDSCGNKGLLAQSCTENEECVNGECKLIETESCKENPSSPCSEAVWKDVPDCVWDASKCDATEPIIPTEENKGELEISQTEGDAKVSNEKVKKPNYVVFGIGAGCLVAGLLLLILSMGKKRRK
jgi:hypothetical protein